MDFLFTSLIATIALGAGLASLAGVRAFLPLAIVGLLGRLDIFSTIDFTGTGFAFLESTWVLALLLTLAVIEIGGDKVPVVDSVQDLVATPLRIASGAVVFGAVLAQEDTVVLIVGMVAGAFLAAVAHFVKGIIRPGATVVGGGDINPFLSFFEDLLVVLGTLALALLPLLGFLIVLFLFFLVYRLRRRRRRKYGGLRILRD